MVKNNFFDTPQMVADVYCLEPGQQQRVHSHAGESKIYYVVDGDADVAIGDETRRLGPGGIGCAPAGIEHGVANNGDRPVVLLVAMAPNPNLRPQ
jgi:quercetin dioxygenase-like cupin family protein